MGIVNGLVNGLVNGIVSGEAGKESGFTPLSLPSLTAWWDFSDTSTYDSTSSVGSVTAKDSNAYVLQQLTPAEKPTTGTINGLTAIEGDGVDKHLEQTGLNPLIASPGIYLACVVNPDSGNSSSDRWITIAGDGSSLVMVRNGNVFVRYADATTHNPNITLGTDRYLVEVVQDNAGLTDVLVNGVSAGSLAMGTGSTFSGVKTFDLLATSGGAAAIDGRLGEIVICDTGLSAGDLSSVRTYLNNKWGI